MRYDFCRVYDFLGRKNCFQLVSEFFQRVSCLTCLCDTPVFSLFADFATSLFFFCSMYWNQLHLTFIGVMTFLTCRSEFQDFLCQKQSGNVFSLQVQLVFLFQVCSMHFLFLKQSGNVFLAGLASFSQPNLFIAFIVSKAVSQCVFLQVSASFSQQTLFFPKKSGFAFCI